ncbi:hypothetical protein [Belliella aquatica]|uniref:hypothetical protein n=1 Tax=Belliella aquatica TaxID=1323734 RepID=UPI001667BDE4|nr:hypothetical protein [Belliella aquatica]MCH7405500.1 hypothetical protein [Belliella aquatica]
MKNLLKSFMLIGLFVFASSSIPLTNAMLLENEVDLIENCLTFEVEDDLLECSELEEKLMGEISLFCPYYILLAEMYGGACASTGNPQDCIKFAYYLSKIESDCFPS